MDEYNNMLKQASSVLPENVKIANSLIPGGKPQENLHNKFFQPINSSDEKNSGEIAEQALSHPTVIIISNLLKEIKEALSDAKKQSLLAKERMEKTGPIVRDFKERFFTKPFDVPGSLSKADALYITYKKLMGIK